MGGYPEDGPGLVIIPPQGGDSIFLNKFQIPELGVIGMLGLFTLAARRINQLSAAPEHQNRQVFQRLVACVYAEAVNVGSD